jgi:hypothetical protein
MMLKRDEQVRYLARARDEVGGIEAEGEWLGRDG